MSEQIKEKLAQLKGNLSLLTKIGSLQKKAPKEINLSKVEIDVDDESRSLYVSIQCKDAETYEFLKLTKDFDAAMPNIISMAYAKMKDGSMI